MTKKGWRLGLPNPSRSIATLHGVLLAAGFSAAASSAVPESVADFAQIAKGGFTETVNGSFFQDPFRLRGYPVLASNRDGQTLNTYAWSGIAKDGALYIGTNVDATSRCRGRCQVTADSGAQIWKYIPSKGWGGFGAWGLAGKWEKVFQAPAAIPRWLVWLGRLLDYDLSEIDNIPRDFGYRNMSVCETADRQERIYVATFGIPGYVLYQEKGRFGRETFKTASTAGLNASLLEFSQGGDLDIGYRSLVCFKGRLITAPAGSRDDVDAPTTPTLLINDNPTDQGSAWQVLVDVANDPNLGDPDNLGIFQAEAVGDYLYIATINRTSGFELWRGDGTNCTVPWDANPQCDLVWEKLIDDAAGRPADLITQALNRGGDPTLKNPTFQASSGATMGVFGDSLYIAPSESGFFGISFAEMLRVNDADGLNPTWELLIGWPRQDWGSSGSEQPDGFTCRRDGDIASTTGDLPPADRAFWLLVNQLLLENPSLSSIVLPLILLDNDSDSDDCFATTGAGPGYATNVFSTDPTDLLDYATGVYQYFWRFAQFDDQLYVGTLDIFSNTFAGFGLPFTSTAGYQRPGFDLLRAKNGDEFSVVTYDGFGGGVPPENNDAYGVRTLVDVPGLGLAVGTANPDPFEGTDIYIGTRAPRRVAPFASAGPDQTVYAAPGESTVQAILNARQSHSSFDGGTEVSCEWYAGAADTNCRGRLSQLWTPMSCDEDVPTNDLTATTSGDGELEYSFTVKVSGGHNYACDTTVVTVSTSTPN